MSIGERKERDRDALSRSIVEAAYELVDEGGIDAVSIRAIAERIEYSPRTIYLYFKDKEAVLDAVRLKGFAALGARLEAAGGEYCVPVESLRRLGRAYLDFAIERRNLFTVMCFRVPRALNDCRTPGSEGDYPSFAILERAVAAYMGVPEQADPRVRSLSFALWAMVHGLAALDLFGQDADFSGVDFGAELDRALGVLLPETPPKNKETR